MNPPSVDPSAITLKSIPVGDILPNPEQPRKKFDAGELKDLAESIRQNTLLQPIVVEGPYGPTNIYTIIDGERRWRASKIAGLKEIQCVIRPADDRSDKRLLLALVANLQRADLRPSEEGQAYKKLKELGQSNNAIALNLGINSARVVHRLRLLELGREIMDLIDGNELSKDLRLVTALMEIDDPGARVKTARALASRHAGINAGVEACRRVVEHLNSETISLAEIPALKLSVRKSGPISRPVWDAQAAIGRVPPWLLVEMCMRETCDACGLREVASQATCNGCTMVEMLQRMIKGTKK